VEPGTGRPVLLREQDDGAEILAGSDRYGIPRREAVLCYDGPGELLRDAAMARGRVEALTLHTGWFRRLTVTTDDLGGPTTTYVYRCGARGALPVLAWGAARSFGLRALSTTWLVWLGAMLVVRAVLRRLR
jgi:hypothetical protein